ncbi:sensor histidine kinase [uncultured Propionibacterium sp.]|uniref:sensor histidine kinase n=1 Tax=uncultured Propionibacterium sp. TaxID=218066 RepID=UPI0029310512|nr:sensor histidine kinase [uncultured Propionibacterium sp.]
MSRSARGLRHHRGFGVFCATRYSEHAELTLVLVLLGVLVALAATVTLAREAIESLGDLHVAVQDAVERGGGPVRVYRDDEVGRLAADFNALMARMERQRQQAVQIALRAQESERLRISRELHDEVGQSLTLALHLVRRAGERSGTTVPAPGIDAIGDTVSEALGTVRSISTQLRPGALDDLGLVPALHELCQRITESTGLVITTGLQRPEVVLPDELQLVLYRIAQEALTNVVRHAEARTVTLVFRHHEDYLTLSIRDDGTGRAGPPGGGMQGMRERAAMVGGELSAVSVPGQGTLVDVRVPVEPGGVAR